MDMTIIALHEVTDTTKVEAIAGSMRANGWIGRPILVDDEDSNEPKALTGTHRLAAAELAGVEPVVYSLEGTGVDVAALFFDCVDDDDMVDVIEDSGDEEAIRIMREELEAK